MGANCSHPPALFPINVLGNEVYLPAGSSLSYAPPNHRGRPQHRTRYGPYSVGGRPRLPSPSTDLSAEYDRGRRYARGGPKIRGGGLRGGSEGSPRPGSSVSNLGRGGSPSRLKRAAMGGYGTGMGGMGGMGGYGASLGGYGGGAMHRARQIYPNLGHGPDMDDSMMRPYTAPPKYPADIGTYGGNMPVGYRGGVGMGVSPGMAMNPALGGLDAKYPLDLDQTENSEALMGPYAAYPYNQQAAPAQSIPFQPQPPAALQKSKPYVQLNPMMNAVPKGAHFAGRPTRTKTNLQPSRTKQPKQKPSSHDGKPAGGLDSIDACICAGDCSCKQGHRVTYFAEGQNGEMTQTGQIRYEMTENIGKRCQDHSVCYTAEGQKKWEMTAEENCNEANKHTQKMKEQLDALSKKLDGLKMPPGAAAPMPGVPGMGRGIPGHPPGTPVDPRLVALQPGLGRGTAGSMMPNLAMANTIPPQVGIGPTGPQMGMGLPGSTMSGGMMNYGPIMDQNMAPHLMDEMSPMENPYANENAMYGSAMLRDPRMKRMPPGFLGPLPPRRHDGQRPSGLRRSPYAPAVARLMAGRDKGYPRPRPLGRRRRPEFGLDEGMGMGGGDFDEDEEDEMWENTGDEDDEDDGPPPGRRSSLGRKRGRVPNASRHSGGRGVRARQARVEDDDEE